VNQGGLVVSCSDHTVLTWLVPFLWPLLVLIVLIVLILHLALELGDPGLETDDLELEIVNVG
jgi:hypothetical protein